MSVEVVAIDFDPTIWAVHCDICKSDIGEPTQDEELVDQMYEEHCALHGLVPEN
jgi:hypothetical protein